MHCGFGATTHDLIQFARTRITETETFGVISTTVPVSKNTSHKAIWGWLNSAKNSEEIKKLSFHFTEIIHLAIFVLLYFRKWLRSWFCPRNVIKYFAIALWCILCGNVYCATAGTAVGISISKLSIPLTNIALVLNICICKYV